MPQPSNTQIMQILGRLEEKIDSIDERVKFTNGKVATLMEDKIRRDEREKTLAKMSPPTVRTEQGDVIVQATANKLDAQGKLFLALASLAVVAASALSAWGASQ